MRTKVLADVAKSFMKDYRESGLRTVCTPYMHLIGTYLAEQDQHEHLPSYDMQGVEKSSDLLSRLYFSSSNRAKKPFTTMIQTLYCRLEMNLADPNDRVVMGRYVRTGAFNEADIEEDESAKESLSSSLNLNESNESSSDTTEDEEINSNQEKKEFDSVPTFMSRNIFQVKPRENRWKSFKRRHN
ncbi:unnamed protein product [Rotaria sordida]|uniref:Uncharacterized protein n=1 Tax=Rotaria sordida TaxID=392033 RepID=A0A816BGW1_9BILA|nr:unnamed protein product [Rotaria sordida]CAF1609049.1 unnamed protein product [Rotaria sordida]